MTSSFIRHCDLGPAIVPGMPLVPGIPDHDSKLQESDKSAVVNGTENERQSDTKERSQSTEEKMKTLTNSLETLETPTDHVAARIYELLKPLTANMDEEKHRPSVDRAQNIDDIGKEMAAILCTRSNVERQEIARVYLAKYGAKLLDTLHETFTGEFGELIHALLESPARYDAGQLHRAITSTSMFTGLSTKDSTLVEILCTRNSQQIREIKYEYRRMFGSYLEHDLTEVTWNHLMHLFMWLVTGSRDQSTHIDKKVAHEDAQALWMSDESTNGRDSTMFNVVLAFQSFSQLRAVFVEYQNIALTDIEKAVDEEFSGDHKDALLALIMAVNNKLPVYFAHRLHHAMHSLGTHDTSLIRMLVSRSEIDLQQITQEYKQIYHKTLKNEITAYCKGCYMHGLLTLLHRN